MLGDLVKIGVCQGSAPWSHMGPGRFACGFGYHDRTARFNRWVMPYVRIRTRPTHEYVTNEQW